MCLHISWRNIIRLNKKLWIRMKKFLYQSYYCVSSFFPYYFKPLTFMPLFFKWYFPMVLFGF